MFLNILYKIFTFLKVNKYKIIYKKFIIVLEYYSNEKKYNIFEDAYLVDLNTGKAVAVNASMDAEEMLKLVGKKCN